MSKDPQNFEEWVVDLGDIVQNVPFPGIATEPLQASTDSEENPSIFWGDYPRLVYSGKSYSYYPSRREHSGWQFVGFMWRWFDLDVRSYLEYAQEKQHLARGYYHGNYYDIVHNNRDKVLFLEYLLINSCIVLFAILLFQNVRDGIEILSGTEEKKRVSGQRSSDFYILYQYITENPMKIKLQMLSMDYQIPWFVVESIYTNHSSLSKLVGTPIDKLALSCFDDLYPGVHKSKVHGGTVTLPPGSFKHLLHIFHWSRTPEGKFIVETGSLLQPTKNMGSFYIPSATDLQLSAILFEKHASIDVSFCDRKLSGVMQIAPLHIFEYSFVIYENLLRFERGYMDCGFSITAYVGCIVKLLQAQEDVKLLRANGIVPSTGNDEMGVLSFVQRFKTILSDVYMPDDLYDLSKKVRAHHEKTSSRYYAEFKSRYCANPWIAISVVAGVCLFFLTFIQAVIQAVFEQLVCGYISGRVSEMSKDPQNFEEWVVDLGDIVQNVPFPGIPTESLQASTDCEENPSIFWGDYPRLVYSGKSYYYYPSRREHSGWQFVAFMRRWFDLDVCSYLEYVQEKQHLARGYYHGIYYNIVHNNRDKVLFLEYLLINSCIVLFAILLFQNVRDGIEILRGTKKNRVPGQRSSEFYILYQYITKNPMEIKLQMLRMDYQIPWFVVESIYTNHSSLSKLVGTPIDKLALSCFDDLYPGVHKSKVHGGTVTLPPGGFKHLLHMFHWSRTPEGKFMVEARSLEPIKSIKNMGDFYIPNATDLQLSATVFEKHAGIHISYYNRGLSGVMEIAPLHIYKYSFVIYDMLLKFEQAYVECGFPVTAYVACMMRLLQTKVDAKLFRAKGIVPSTGIVEKDVLSFVQQFRNVLSYDVRMPKDLNILSEKVRAHHEKSYIRSYAELKRRYFANPWVTISVIAGILLFVLTFIHIVLSFIQTKYSVHSYKSK